MSVVVSSTVLLYATIADVRDRAAAKRAEEIAKAYEQELEKRVRVDHELIEQILQNSIENILGGRLEKIRLEDHKQLDEMRQAVIASIEALRAELAEKALIASNESLCGIGGVERSCSGAPPKSFCEVYHVGCLTANIMIGLRSSSRTNLSLAQHQWQSFILVIAVHLTELWSSDHLATQSVRLNRHQLQFE